jgi:hypothetical protein
MTHREQGRIDKGNALALPFACLQIGTEGHQCCLPHLHKAGGTHQLRKSPAQMRSDVAQKIILTRARPRLLKANEDRPHFTYTQATRAQTLAFPIPKQALLPGGLQLLTEVVNVTEQRYNLPTRTSSVTGCWLLSPLY